MLIEGTIMDEPKSLDSLFKEKLFRIPDFQRGYAWQKQQLNDFWEDLVNLGNKRSHYTGVVTLKEIPLEEIPKKDRWLVDDHSYRMYHIIDGQQRLTTFVIFIQSFIEFVHSLPQHKDKQDGQIYLTDTLNISHVIDKYLFKLIPPTNLFRTYKFGYTVDNPSYEYMRYRIFCEEGIGSIEETFYTLNLRNAKIYFKAQVDAWYKNEGWEGIQRLYKTLTKSFLFNEYIIKDEFDVFVAFETMNNRGKKLSDLELLKNRLIYLTTLYSDTEIDDASRQNLRDEVNDAWKEVYHQLGRNDKRPLNDDDFLKAHWIMYFKYSRKRGNDYIKFLLDEQFTPKNIYKKVEKEVLLDLPEEQRTEFEIDDLEVENGEEETKIIKTALLAPDEIKRYVQSIKSSAVHWFNTHYPFLSNNLSIEEKEYIDKLNRIGMGYFRPLIMSILKNEKDPSTKVKILSRIERYIFICFKLGQAYRNYGDSEFYNAAREYDKGDLDINGIAQKLSNRKAFLFDKNGAFITRYFKDYLYKRFHSGSQEGFYSWNGIRYFLYEYELKKMKETGQKKVDWQLFIKHEKDKISIEHIFPQTSTVYWNQVFSLIPRKQQHFYRGSLGNLLLLSLSINTSLQNDSFEEKKKTKFDQQGNKLRNGYSDGSHSEIEVANKYISWTPLEIKQRGLSLLDFMEKRWDIDLGGAENKLSLLFLPSDE